MLSSVLDADITHRIVRLGRRASSDARIEQYCIETLETAQTHSRLDRTLSDCRRGLRDVQNHIQGLMKRVLDLDIDNNTDEIMKYLSTFYPEHFEYLSSPPLWVPNVKGFVVDDDDSAGKWHTAGRGGKAHILDRSTYAFWRNCFDIAFIDQVLRGSLESQKSPTKIETHAPRNAFNALKIEIAGDDHSSDEDLSDTESISEGIEVEESWKAVRVDHVSSLSPPIQPILPAVPETMPPAPVEHKSKTNRPSDIKDVDGLFEALEFECTPSIPHSDRSLEELLEDVGDVWKMSVTERQRVHIFWVEQVRIQLGQTYMDEFKRLRNRHADMLQEYNEGKEEVCCFNSCVLKITNPYQVRRGLLREMDIIGCTTTGQLFSVTDRKAAYLGFFFHNIGAAQLTSLLNVRRISLLHPFLMLTNNLGIKPQSSACRRSRPGHGGSHPWEPRTLY